MNNWFVIRRGHVYTIEQPASHENGLRYGRTPASRSDCQARAERLATTAARKASGGRKGQWYVDKINDDTYVVRKGES